MIDVHNPARNSISLWIASSVLADYREEYVRAHIPNWDGAGALPLMVAVQDLAERLIDKFGTLENSVEVTPGRDGSLSFVWEDNDGRYIYLDVGPNDTIHLYHDVIGLPKWEGGSVASDSRILEQLAQA
jgi:hypothetical protein